MTPDECRPGTVVQWDDWVGVVQSTFNNGHKDHRARVSNWERMVPLVLPDEVEAYDDQQPGETVDCEDLRLAPRFLVGSEWQADNPTDALVLGRVDYSVELGWYYVCCAAGDRMMLRQSDTYLAARQAVERACGIERTE
jgi:hypothetical protein